jgi:hypothetical protein
LACEDEPKIMIEALRFPPASPKLVAPPISAGLPNGLVLQLWIRRNADATRQPIVELAAANSRIVLGTGDRFDVLSLSVIAGGKTTEIIVPGALPMQRWVQVRATVTPTGTAELDVLGMKLARGMLPLPGTEARTLMIGGLVGELALLQVWKISAPGRLSYDPPSDLSAGNLWAYYPLAALEWDATKQQSVVKDAGPHQRHAVLQGSTNVPTRVVHDEPLDRGQAAHLRFVSNDHTPKIGPLIGLSGRLTLEAWVCPVGDWSMPVFQVQGTELRLVLVAGGPNNELALLSIDHANKIDVLARATGLVQPNQWSHVAVTLEVAQAKTAQATSTTIPQLTVSLFQQGQLRKREKFWLVQDGVPVRVGALIKQALIPWVAFGGLAPGYPFFRGGMAEVRVWRRAAQERVEALWLARARGDETDLIACYRLDTDPAQDLVDISPRRGFVPVPSGTALAQEQCPPLAATSGTLAFRVQARGKLLREKLPIGSSLTRDTFSQMVHTNTSLLAPTGRFSLPRNVFHVTIDVASRSGNSPLDRVLDVRLDQPLTLLQTNGSQLVQTPWAANQTHSIPLPASGRVRLRFDAKQLACPALRVRVAGTPGCVWTVVRPDETVQTRLREVTTESLKTPADGRRSPLPVGTSDADAQALADALARLGTQLVRQPSASSNSSTSDASTRFIDDVVDLAEDGYDATVEVVEDTYEGVVSSGQTVISTGQDVLAGATTVAKSAGNLIVSGANELEALTAKCAKVSAWVGEQAISNAISSANTLAFVGAQSWGEAARWVEVIGTSIVDGTEVAWRVIVSTVDDALAAVTNLIERIGAQIQEWIDYLAWLFMWDDFLEASDEALKVIEEAMADVGQQIAGLDGLKNQLTDALRGTIEDEIGKRSLGDMLGIDADAASPAFEQLDYVLGYVEDLFDSADLAWGGSELGEGAGIGPSEAVDAQAGEMERLQPLGDPSDVLGFLSTPLSELLASNEELANGSSSIFDAVFDPIMASTTEMLEQIDSAMFGRLSVPYLTDFIEETILFGRTLTVARIAALMAAIPAVLEGKLSSSSSEQNTTTSTTELSPESRSTTELTEAEKEEEEERQKFDRKTRWALWVVMGLGMINTVVIISKSACERRQASPANSKHISACKLASGGIGMLRGIFLVGRVDAFTPDTRVFAKINAYAELTGGVCTAFFGIQGLKPIGKLETRTDWSKAEAVIQLLLGALVIATSTAGLSTGKFGDDDRTKTAFSLRCCSWVLSLSVRAFEKLDDSDTSGRLRYVTMGLAGLQVVAEVTEAIYSNVGETEAQT